MAAAKTSASHPLRIDAVGLPDGGGAIGLTFCPGKKHHGPISGAWNRDLLIDLQAIQAFGAKALVTLMGAEELDEVKVPVTSLSSWAKEVGLEWHHLPIEDVNVPDERFEDLWTYSGLRLRSLLARGQKIVIHCRGGLGRSGTVAGRLLVEFGEEPEIAIRRIRDARHGCVETFAQEEYVRNCRPIAFARVERSQEERALACLLGGAIGDALGYEIEFQDLRHIREHFGEGGIKTPVFHDGKLIVSDDTQMTLFTLEGLLRSWQEGDAWRESCIPSIREAYLDWKDSQGSSAVSGGADASGWLLRQSEMRVRRAPGSTCLSALDAGGHGTIHSPINNSKGCGGAMRVAPLGLIASRGNAKTAFRLATEAAALTHGHPCGYLSAGVVASLVHQLLDGISLNTRPRTAFGTSAMAESNGFLLGFSDHHETSELLNAAVALAASRPQDHARAIETLGGGWVGEEALAIAMYAVLSADTFVEAVLIAANHSGDSDSTSSIAGQLWGAMNGLAGMPNEWIMALDVLRPLLHLSRQLISSSFR